MTAKRFVLRSLPGVMEVEALIKAIDAHPNPNWAPENDQLPGAAYNASMRLFGINKQDTEFDDNTLGEDDDWYDARDRWEQNFAFAEYYFEGEGTEAEQEARELAIWELFGWDVTDGAGKPLGCLFHFYRQIICAVKGLKGHLPGAEMSDEEAATEAERWAKKLLAETNRPRRRAS